MVDGPRSDLPAPDRAYQVIKHALLSGELGPGDLLPEEKLAALTGVSRTPVREALRRLSAEGLVDVRPNRGARVPSWSDEELDAIFELRLRLEGYAARSAAERVGEGTVAVLEELATAMEREARHHSDGMVGMAELNNQFHLRIIESSGSHSLLNVTAGVVNFGLVNHTFRVYSPADLDRSMHHHREIIDAIRYHDGEWAEAVMRAHLLAARRVLQGPVAVPEHD